MRHTTVVPGCFPNGNTHRPLPVLSCLWVPADPIFRRNAIALLEIRFDPILSKSESMTVRLCAVGKLIELAS